MSMFDLFGTTTPTAYQPPVTLTIAGSDSGGGAGIQADLKTFAACAAYGASIVTLVTAQNTRGVSNVHVLPDEVVRAQFEAVMPDLEPRAAKTGALGNDRMIGLVTECLTQWPIERLVVDPVLVSKHGDPLMSESAARTLVERLLPHCLIVTPNRHEAQVLTGRAVEGPSSMKDAAKALFDRGARNVLIKGAHLDRIVRDIVYDGSGFVEFGADRVDSDRVHGSGCAHSAAITARLAHGDELLEAVAFAREFISSAIEKAPSIGHGISPVNPMHARWP